MKCWKKFSMLFVAAWFISGANVWAQDNSVVIRLKDQIDTKTFKEFQEKYKASILETAPNMKAQVLRLNEKDVPNVVESLRADPRVEYIELTPKNTKLLFSDESLSLFDLAPRQQTLVRRLKENPASGAIRLTRLGPKDFKMDLLKHGMDVQGTVDLDLPGGQTAKAIREKIMERTADDFTWYGKLSDQKGEVVLVVRDSGISGTIIKENETYSIKPLGSGLHAVIHLDQKLFPPEHPPQFDQKKPEVLPQGSTMDLLPDADSCQSETGEQVDVMVAYTKNAKEAVADIDGLIQLAIDETNQSYEKSGVATHLKLVKKVEVDYQESGIDFDTILDHFQGKLDGHMDHVHQIRDDAAADIAVLIIDNGQYCGVASSILAKNDSESFALVHHDCATGYYSFGHEIGHLQGARHDLNVDPTLSPFSFGHGHVNNVNGPFWRTIMAYGNFCSGCRRVNIWSNPSKDYQGGATGVSGASENERVLNQTKTRISRFRCGAGDRVFAELPVSPPLTKGAIDQPGEKDTFQFVINNNGDYVVETHGGTDVYMTLFGPDNLQTKIAEDDDSGENRNSKISRTLSPGTYFAQIRHYSQTDVGDYQILVRPME